MINSHEKDFVWIHVVPDVLDGIDGAEQLRRRDYHCSSSCPTFQRPQAGRFRLQRGVEAIQKRGKRGKRKGAKRNSQSRTFGGALKRRTMEEYARWTMCPRVFCLLFFNSLIVTVHTCFIMCCVQLKI